MPLLETKGAASAQGFGGAGAGASGPVTYIEDVFSTWLVTPTSSNTNYSVTNGIDVSGKGGMVWMKARNVASTNNLVYDTARGASAGSNNALITNSTNAQQTAFFDYITGLSNGFTVNFVTGGGQLTNNGINYASWTFREQPKFFDVVTYTGDGANRTISHNLGSVPGCIIVKRTDAAADWQVYHRSLANTQYLVLNSTAVVATGTTRWNSTTPTSTVFSLGTDTTVNANGGTYVAYLFAHNAGGFGLSGTDNVISCGSYTGTGSAQLINLGYEPQWVLIKQTDAADQWAIIDNMRGWAQSDSATLCANTANAENADFSASGATSLDPQGFRLWNANGALNQSGGTYIYIAIRRGPMKTPTSGTSVFVPTTAGVSGGTYVQTGWPPDASIFTYFLATGTNRYVTSRLFGNDVYLNPGSSISSATYPGAATWNSKQLGYESTFAQSAYDLLIQWVLRRAPGFFDVVCYTGTGSATTQAHNLGVVPELMIIKTRSNTNNWAVYCGQLLNTQYLILNGTAFAQTNTTYWNSTSPTDTVFTIGSASIVNTSAATYVAYLFASCPGVSKVGSYTGTGTTLQIDCGFTGGSRFVLIKRTDSTGDWYVWDSARGIVAGNDPYLLLNSNVAEVTTTDWVDTYSAGFELSNAAGNNVNINAATYIFLSVA